MHSISHPHEIHTVLVGAYLVGGMEILADILAPTMLNPTTVNTRDPKSLYGFEHLQRFI